MRAVATSDDDNNNRADKEVADMMEGRKRLQYDANKIRWNCEDRKFDFISLLNRIDGYQKSFIIVKI